METAIARGSTDNISVIVAQLAALHGPTVTVDDRPARLRFSSKHNVRSAAL